MLNKPETLAHQVADALDEDIEVGVEVAEFVEFMRRLTAEQRVVVRQVLSDFYCPLCGRDQPEGDCQC